MKLIYDVNDKPKGKELLAFAFQQLLAIMAATIAVPAITGNGMTASAALFGAGIGTLVYQLFTKFKSPVFLGSSFAFLGSMSAAFAGAVSVQAGYTGIILGAFFAGLVYVLLSGIIKLGGVNWISKLMPASVIGPTVAIIGLSLAGNAVGDMLPTSTSYAKFICALVTLFTVIICSVYGKKMTKLIPFIIGIGAGYVVALIMTIIGTNADIESLVIINFAPIKNLLTNGKVTINTFLSMPKFTFLTAFKGLNEINGAYVATIFVAFAPVAFVVFAEHIADHKNLSTIINKDLLKEPGLCRTLLGDGVGSMAGAFFGGCANTTYGESVACVALTGNASVRTIFATAIMAIAISFLSPFEALLETIPSCVMGGVCMTLYGFIAVSGLKMIKDIDFEDNGNIYTVSVILIAGIGGLSLTFGKVTITSIACALILGIVTNLIVKKRK